MISKAAIAENTANAETLRPFIGKQQLATMLQFTRGEEGAHFAQKLAEYAERVSQAPRVYEQDGKGEEAIVYLHYFFGNMDWYITELDTDEPHIGFADTPQPRRKLSAEQIQAFGLADLGYGAELGYISIAEIISCNVELDLYWTPKPLREVKERKEVGKGEKQKT